MLLEPSEEGGCTALAPSLPGCVGAGDTREEAIADIREAVLLDLEPVEDGEDFAPEAELLEITR